MRQPKNIMPSPTLLGGEGQKDIDFYEIWRIQRIQTTEEFIELWKVRVRVNIPAVRW